MSVGIFTDKEDCPTEKSVMKILGDKRNEWIELNDYLHDKYSIKVDMRFYGKNYGWALRFRKSGKALISLYPAEGSFMVQIVLGLKECEAALSEKISSKIKGVIEKAAPFKEGKWLFVPVKTSKDLKDVKYLLSLKAGI